MSKWFDTSWKSEPEPETGPDPMTPIYNQLREEYSKGDE